MNGHAWGEVEEIGAKNQITFVRGLINQSTDNHLWA
jgi:hypothetical protein